MCVGSMYIFVCEAGHMHKCACVCVCVDVRTHLRCSSGAAHLVFEEVSLPGLSSGSKLG